MNRLPTELHRLYAPPAPDDPASAPEQASLVNAQGQVRAMVLELGRPADWAPLAKVWHGVQTELDLPAPAIAVSGVDGYQLWFSLAEPLPAAQALAFLESLRTHFLADIKPHRISLMPAPDAASAGSALDTRSPWPARHAPPVPAQQASSGRWSAFVAPDLAPVFADEPWLDLPPNPDGQAALLSRLKSIVAADFQRAVDTLRPALPTLRAVELPRLSRTATTATPAEPAAHAAHAAHATHAAPAAPAAPAEQAAAGLGPVDTPAGAWRAPQDFLLDVMNDDRVALALRIEAAKALLPYFHAPRNPRNGRRGDHHRRVSRNMPRCY